MKTTATTYIISPSGNFYGSEQVLFDFLEYSEHQYRVYVPRKSKLESKLKSQGKHTILSFSSIPLFYLRLLFQLVLKKRKLYINEGGHVKYIKLLAKLFSKNKFIVQIRLLDDTSPQRLNNLPSNIKLVCVSKYIANHIQDDYKPIILNDPFTIPCTQEKSEKSSFIIGFVGRVTPTKGLKEAQDLLVKLEKESYPIQVNFYGTVEDDKEEVKQFVKHVKRFKNIAVCFKGFVDKKEAIYKDLSVVIHLNKEEAFPRIALESWAYGVPLVGFNAGGIGEINNLLGASEFLIEDRTGWEDNIISTINGIRDSYPVKTIETCKATIASELDIHEFTKKLERLLS